LDKELSLTANFRKSFGIIQSQGIGAFIKKLGNQLNRISYEDWIKKFDTLTERDTALIKSRIKMFSKLPCFGIVLLFNDSEKVDFRNEEIRRTYESLRSQFYTNWNLLIDDSSLLSDTNELIENLRKVDSRIKLVGASEETLKLDYVTGLYEGDTVSPHAFYLAAEVLQKNSPNVIYSDEDLMDTRGVRSAPVFKSGWNPDLFKHRNYFGGLNVLRNESIWDLTKKSPAELLNEITQVRLTPCDCSQDKISHLPFVLYHKIVAKREDPKLAKQPYRVFFENSALSENSPEPLVSIIVLTKDKEFLLRKCIESIQKKTTYKKFEIIIVDNGSTEIGALKYLEDLKSSPDIKIIKNEEPFNFSRLNNLGAEVARGEVLAFLNNDVEVIASDWLSSMVTEVMSKGVGVVGARLWYPNNTLQHGGIILGLGGIAGHLLRGLTKRDECQDGFTDEVRTVSAVTAACMVTRRSVFVAQGGFNERDLSIAYNDVDYCLRVQHQGLRVMYQPAAELYHHESATRRADYAGENIKRYQRECDYMRKEWGDLIANDPFFSPNLSLHGREVALATPPRIIKPWLSDTP
jgi:GT2 family glycosyltransferase